jgi:hypothetical protein
MELENEAAAPEVGGVQELPDVVQELPDVLLAAIRDGVVSDRTRACYLKENFYFLLWLRNTEPTCLTAFGLNVINGFVSNAPAGLSDRQFYARNRAAFQDVVRSCDTTPILVVDVLSPEVYMNYCHSLRNIRTRQYLGKSTIGVKRAALYHLFRLHNGSGYSSAFNLTLNNLFRGFYRVLTSRRSIVSETIIGKDNEPPSTRSIILPKWNQVKLFFLFFYLFFFN